MNHETYPELQECEFYPDKEGFILGLLKGIEIKSILDVGAGHGGVFAYGYWDGRTDMEKREACDLFFCRPMSPRWTSKVGVDARKLTDFYPAKSFDLVQCMETLEHMHNPIKAVEQMLFVARKAVVITSACIAHHIGPAQEESEKWNPHLKYIAQPKVKGLLDLGMEVRVANQTEQSQLIAWKILT